jgi:hypothetical protein
MCTNNAEYIYIHCSAIANMKPGCWAGFKKVHTAARKEVGRTNTL